ncbi:palmitoyl-protein thioesterase 1-like [Impatiens glandulifera]|uniref:palmitoyl-protein thioesterase 1-like n=1 Tax=Impatiens glandulifera TaxID=253017 RepID=UPI001FB14B79|nr:palmitoyl-protein thioesterase 1-like [Impatiens glandulifera]
MAKLIIFTLALFLAFTSAYSLPFVVFHGVSHNCKTKSVQRLTNLLSNWSGSEGQCIETGDSWLVPIKQQTEIACEKVKNISELSKGYNIVGLSQGNIISRAVIEFCEGAPQVNNYISLAGPHAGIGAFPYCGSGQTCKILHYMIKLGIYTKYVQENFAPAGYVKDPNAINQYMKGSNFLPRLNNEYKDQKNDVYKQRFASLQNLVLIKFDDDDVLIPNESAWFGFFTDGSRSRKKILPVQETELYKEDWIGLRSLDEAGRVQFINVTGKHIEITDIDAMKYIVPYLVERSAAR